MQRLLPLALLEFYNFKSIDPSIHVLVDIDEKSYSGGTNGDRHPMVISASR